VDWVGAVGEFEGWPDYLMATIWSEYDGAFDGDLAMLDNHEVLFVFFNYGSLGDKPLEFFYAKCLNLLGKLFFEVDLGCFECYIHFTDGLSS